MGKITVIIYPQCIKLHLTHLVLQKLHSRSSVFIEHIIKYSNIYKVQQDKQSNRFYNIHICFALLLELSIRSVVQFPERKSKLILSCKVSTSQPGWWFTLGSRDPPISPGFLHRQESLQSPDMATQDFLKNSVECMSMCPMRNDLKKLQWDKTRQTN